MSRNWLLISDLHFAESEPARNRFALLDQIQEWIKERPIHRLVCLGDITDAKDRHSAKLVRDVVEFFCRLSSQIPRVEVIFGNHDYADPKYPFFMFLQLAMGSSSGVTFYSRPTLSDDRLYLPHIENSVFPETMEKFAAENDLSAVSWVFTHQCYAGSKFFGKELGGVDPQALLKHIPEMASVFAGDIHSPQTLADRIEYVGAPYHTSFGCEYDGRCLLVDPAAHTWQSLRVNHPDIPQFVTLDVENERELGEKVASLDDRRNSIVRVRIKSSGDFAADRKLAETAAATVRKMEGGGRVKLKGVEGIASAEVNKAALKSVNQATDSEVFDMYCVKEKIKVASETYEEGRKYLEAEG